MPQQRHGGIVTAKELRQEIDRLVAEIQGIQAMIDGLAAKLMDATTKERKDEGIRQTTGQ